MAAPIILRELPANEWNLREWWEELANDRPGGAGAFSSGMSEDVLTIEVPYNKIRSCIRQLVGYSYSDAGTPYRLHRPEVMVQHPTYKWLWADSASVLPFNPLGNPQYQVRTGVYHPKTSASSTYNSPRYTGNYKRAHVSVRFKEFFGRIIKDSDSNWTNTTPEYGRFVGPVSILPKNELISATGGTEGSSLVFADTTSPVVGPPAIAGGPQFGPTGTVVQGSVYTTKQVVEINLLWKQVAEDYLMDTGEPYYELAPIPKRLLAHLGTVNKTKIWGREAGTLLFDGIGLQRKQQPVPTTTEFGAWAFDINLKFQFFDPKRPPTSSIATTPAGQTPLRGWHCQPWKANSYWYGCTKGSATTQGTYDGQTQLIQTEFADMFKHWSTVAGAYPV